MQKKMCEVCRHPYESEDHLCREAMPASDGGPAFPVSADVAGMEGLSGSALGMTLRDYFATRAMQALLGSEDGLTQALDELASDSYRIADAMLRARGIAPAADTVREAAPELLEACKAVDEWLMEGFADSDADDPVYNEAFRRALRTVRAAIAKATGQEG